LGYNKNKGGIMQIIEKYQKCEQCPYFKLGAVIGDYALQPLCQKGFDGDNEYELPTIYHSTCE